MPQYRVGSDLLTFQAVVSYPFDQFTIRLPVIELGGPNPLLQHFVEDRPVQAFDCLLPVGAQEFGELTGMTQLELPGKRKGALRIEDE